MNNVITKDNYNLKFTDTDVYLEHRVHKGYIMAITVASISTSDHKKVVVYRTICKNDRPNIRYYSFDKYKYYIERRVKEFLDKYNIEIKDDGSWNIIKIVNS